MKAETEAEVHRVESARQTHPSWNTHCKMRLSSSTQR